MWLRFVRVRECEGEEQRKERERVAAFVTVTFCLLCAVLTGFRFVRGGYNIGVHSWTENIVNRTTGSSRSRTNTASGPLLTC